MEEGEGSMPSSFLLLCPRPDLQMSTNGPHIQEHREEEKEVNFCASCALAGKLAGIEESAWGNVELDIGISLTGLVNFVFAI